MLLAHLQQQLLASLFPSQDADLSSTIIYRNRLVIHRETSHAAQISALCATYPYTEKLIGLRCFRQLSKQYITHHPATHPNLYQYGEKFPAFLANHSVTQPLVYLPDFALLEWNCHQLYHASDNGPLSIVMKSDYPLLAILDLCEGKECQTIDLSQFTAQTILIKRCQFDVILSLVES